MVRAAIALLLLMSASSAAHAEPRIALIITNQAYTQPGARLANTHSDGDVVKAALEKVGFKVWVTRDTASEGALLQAIGEHVQRLAEAGPEAVGFLYYSGHGAADRPDGANYLVPTAAPLTHVSQLPLMAVRLDRVTATLASAGKMSFVVFDACRNVPLQRDTKDLGFKGFAPVREQRGLLIAYATEPGDLAIDESIYARALANEIVKPGLEAGQAFRAITRRVWEGTEKRQSPEYLDKRLNDFYFVAPQAVPPSVPGVTDAAREWARVDKTNLAALEQFVRKHGASTEGDYALWRIDSLTKRAAPQEVPTLAPPKGEPLKIAIAPAEQFVVQVTSQRSRTETIAALVALKGKYAQPLAGKQFGIMERSDGKETWHRGVFGPPMSRQDADAACSQLRAAGAQCVIVAAATFSALTSDEPATSPHTVGCPNVSGVWNSWASFVFGGGDTRFKGDGTWVHTSSGQGGKWWCEGTQLRILKPGGSVERYKFSADGKQIIGIEPYGGIVVFSRR